MLIEFLSHAAALDLGWIVGLILGNLHWLFALGAFVIISHNGRRPVWHFLVIFALLWAIVDMEHFLQLAFVPMLIFVPLDWTIRIFLENTSMEKHILKVIVGVFLLLTCINTFYFSLPGG